MSLTIFISKVEISGVVSRQSQPSLYSGKVGVEIIPNAGPLTDSVEIAISFSGLASLPSGINYALAVLDDFGDRLKLAVQQASELYK